MCLAVPMKLLKIDGDVGSAELGGIVKEISLSLLDEVKIGDYVLIHAGFAIQKLDEKEALDTISLLNELGKND